MDASEAIVEKLLRNMGFQKVVYEPDGNVPPDFLVDDEIAVEVRRLNQNHDSGGGKRGLEETSIPLWQKIEKLAHSFGPADGVSWFVFFRFSRPVKPWKKLESELRKAFASFKARSSRTAGRIYANKNFELEVWPASKPLQHYFRMGGTSDDQSGGLIVAEMLDNIEHCASEKLEKISDHKNKYAKWWLVLTDHIGRGLDDFDKEQLLSHAKRPVGWDKIIVVSPSNPDNWFEF